jgi:phage shock protein C
MYCTKCGVELQDGVNFCSRCGNRTAAWTAEDYRPRPLMLDKQNKKIAGVCAGFARYFDMDITLMRVIWLALALCSGGLGFIVYLAAWILIPSDYGNAPAAAPTPHANTV